MYFISNYYEGYETSSVPKYWRIHSGIEQGDAALSVELNLALALKQLDEVKSVEFETFWGQGRTTAECTGDSIAKFIKWINDCFNQ